MVAVIIAWCICAFIIFWAMIGYPISLLILDEIFKRDNIVDYSENPSVTIMVVAHNEEKVILQKLNNIIHIDYPLDKLEILVASDFSTDKTNDIVEQFINDNPEIRIRLHKTKNHFGKTNAQNETQELCNTEILVMTDANAMLDSMAVRELVASFTSADIAYVSGKLKYMNENDNQTAQEEGFYWKLELKCREIESKIQTITAGNGALYAVRNEDYIKIPPIECHDFSFPLYYALNGKRAIYNGKAIAIEKAGESTEDEFKRKVRMNRTILHDIIPTLKVFNVFRMKWFSYFYFGHRTCRYLLWLAHTLLFLLSIVLAGSGSIWQVLLGLQILFYGLAFIGHINKGSKNRFINIASYYCMTILAQWKGVLNIVTGKAKPTWEKAESTR